MDGSWVSQNNKSIYLTLDDFTLLNFHWVADMSKSNLLQCLYITVSIMIYPEYEL